MTTTPKVDVKMSSEPLNKGEKRKASVELIDDPEKRRKAFNKKAATLTARFLALGAETDCFGILYLSS